VTSSRPRADAGPSRSSNPNPLRRLARAVTGPLERFFQIQAASGLSLLFAAAVALLLANSPWSNAYRQLWQTSFGITLLGFTFQRSLEWVVNDGLMVVFFFLVGLEIRRELHDGELAQWRRAALPAAAALGGMLAPAAIYLALVRAPEGRSGWGVPMATDIAFAVGLLALLGNRVPAALRVLLLALAVIDDLGAIVVIALFYSAGVGLAGVFVALGGFGLILLMQRFGVRSKLAYVAPALLAWAGVYAAGVHPTIAGVIVGLLTPVRPRLEPDNGLGEASSPAQDLIRGLHPWVAFGIMPLFALVNAGVSLRGLSLDASSTTTAMGVAVALVVGKPVGVLIATWLCVRSGLGALPRGIGGRQLLVLGVVAGVGFTMSLFVAQLAFADLRLLSAAKLGILTGSALAGALALLLGRFLLTTTQVPGAAETVEQAESSTEA
jgi:Na+:H+ antiporter, NhaA family